MKTLRLLIGISLVSGCTIDTQPVSAQDAFGGGEGVEVDSDGKVRVSADVVRVAQACNTGQAVVWDGQKWACAVISTGAHTTSLDWNDITSRPGGLDDGDELDALAASASCAEGDVPKYRSATGWVCEADITTAASGALVVSAENNVGIGTDAPQAQLHVVGSLKRKLTGQVSVSPDSAGVSGLGTLFTKELALGAAVEIAGEVFEVAGITDDLILTLDGPHQAGSGGPIDAFADPEPLFAVENGAGREVMRVSGDGNVGIGTVGPVVGLQEYLLKSVMRLRS